MTRRTRWALAALALLAALAALHTATWLYVTARIEAGIAPFLAAASAQGWRIEGGTPHRAGWPLAASLRIPDVAATRPLGDGILRWHATSLLLTIAPLDPGQLRIAPEGPQSLEAAGQTIPLQAERASLTLPLRSPGPAQLQIAALTAGPPRQSLQVADLTAQITPLALALHASGLASTPPLPPPFDTPADLRLRLTANHPLPALDTQSATAWRTAGGAVAIDELVLLCGPLTASGAGTLRLDAALQPESQAELRVLGAPELIEALAKARLLRPNAATAARAVIALLALGAPGRPISLPATLEGQVLTVAQFPLLRLPSVDWPP